MTTRRIKKESTWTPYSQEENGRCNDAERPQAMAPERLIHRPFPSVRSSPRGYRRYLHHSTLLLYRISWGMLPASSILSTQSIRRITLYEPNFENAMVVSRIRNQRHHTSYIRLIHIKSRRVSLTSPAAISPWPLRPKAPQAFPLDTQRAPIPVIRDPWRATARLVLLVYRWVKLQARMMADADIPHLRWIRHIVAC